jgi:UDP-glucose 4-epimerase
MTRQKNKRNLNILVTGGSGFIGSHIADALTDEGHHVTIFDIKKSPYLKKKQKMVVGDIMYCPALTRAMKGIDAVFHLAAFSDIDTAKSKPAETMNTNVIGTTNVLESARANKTGHVIFASTIYVYSRTGSFYRVSKHACELLLEAYQERYGIDYTILRFGTLYGPRTNRHNSVYRYLKEALNTGKIDFYGTGDEVREYIHVADAAKICAELLKSKYRNQTFILTGHHRTRVIELLEMIKEILGSSLKIRHHAAESKSHYTQTPYSYIPRIGKKMVLNTYCDLGQSLVEILHEIDPKRTDR